MENVSKIYPTLGSQGSIRREGINFIRRVVSNALEKPIEPRTRGFQALKDVSFNVYPGEGVALVGQNGAGKTTLISLIANIMRPTSGTITVNGRYAALIGVTTGFLKELTGRQNIYLNAAIYGLPPKETDHIIDKVIDFADIGPFINRQVREYSSGMKARLGFSVAIHILPDIILLDEALAVGDAAFKQKCKVKIDSLLSEGRTLVLVSHSSGEVLRLCQRAVWLHKGEVKMIDSAEAVIGEYEGFSTLN